MRRIPNKNPVCNCVFLRIGDHRSLKELVDDPRIKVHYDPVQEVVHNIPTLAYTRPGDKENLFIEPYGCRMGRWELARALVHELTHITLTPESSEKQEAEAQLMEIKCGFRRCAPATTIIVTPKP